MPLPSSGQIDLNQIHVEVGGGSGSQCSLGDSDISSLIGYSTSQQKSFSNYYGASAGPSLAYTSYGTSWFAATTGKTASPAVVWFQNSAATNIIASMWTGVQSGGSLNITDAGLYTSSGFQGQGVNMFDGNNPPVIIGSNGGSFNRPHGTGSGQHYIKIYYGSTLQLQSNSQWDTNTPIAPTMGDTNSGPINVQSKSSASSWRVEYYV